MKKLMTMAAVLFSTVVFAGGTDENPTAASGVAVMKKDGGTFHLIYKGEAISDVRVSIYDAKNKLVFSETLKGVDGFLRPYNFSELAEGEYTISISDGNTKKVEKVDYRSGSVTKLVNVVKIGADNKYLLTAAGKGEERITVNIFGKDQELLHTESKLTSGNFAQVYNVAKVTGALTFEIINGNGEAKRIQY